MIVLLLLLISAPPDITHISDNKTVIENDIVTLICIADGHPPPSITWTQLSDNSVVTFPLTISRQDEGYYRCTANNSIGSPATKDVFITVLCKCLIVNSAMTEQSKNSKYHCK